VGKKHFVGHKYRFQKQLSTKCQYIIGGGNQSNEGKQLQQANNKLNHTKDYFSIGGYQTDKLK
jgi:hypothetical protein